MHQEIGIEGYYYGTNQLAMLNTLGALNVEEVPDMMLMLGAAEGSIVIDFSD